MNTTHSSTEARYSIGESEEPPQPDRLPEIDVRLQAQPTRGVNLEWIREHLARAATLIAARTGRPVGSVDVLVIDDSEMIRLNQLHTGEGHTTDVLSFDLAESTHSPIQADIAICLDEAARRAQELGHSIERELLLYALHGLLHCAGFDDQTDPHYRLMHAEEDRILNAIGVGSTFAVGTSDPSDAAPEPGGEEE